jgi:hypothetical protein
VDCTGADRWRSALEHLFAGRSRQRWNWSSRSSRALAASDRGSVLELGMNKDEGSGQALLSDPRVRQLYLGA